MNRDRKILLIILFISLLASLTVINVVILKDKLDRTFTTKEVLEKQYSKLHKGRIEVDRDDINILVGLIEKEKVKFIPFADRDPYKLGLELIKNLEKSRLIVLQYRTIEEEQSFLLEFHVEGPVSGFFLFLQNLYSTDVYYRIPLFTIRNENRGISATFRIGYSIYE